MKLRRLLFIGAAGAAIEYFFDRDSGKGRRTRTRDMVAGKARTIRERMDRVKRYGSAEMEGLHQRMAHAMRGDRPPVDDVELAHKVESRVFARPGMPKGRINVNVEDGIVYLRGQLENEMQIRRVERVVYKIDGVAGVVSLLHIDGHPAPNKEEALRASSRAANEMSRIGRST